MRRREVITRLGGTATIWPLAARAQATPPIIGYLSPGGPDRHRPQGPRRSRKSVLKSAFGLGSRRAAFPQPAKFEQQGELNEDAREFTRNRSAGGRRHDRKCPTVREPHSTRRTDGRRRHSTQRACDSNPCTYRAARETCPTADRVGKPHCASRTRGRGRQAAGTLILLRELAVANEGASAPSLRFPLPLRAFKSA